MFRNFILWLHYPYGFSVNVLEILNLKSSHELKNLGKAFHEQLQSWLLNSILFKHLKKIKKFISKPFFLFYLTREVSQ